MGRTNAISCVQLLFMLVSWGEHIYYVLNNLYQYICLLVPEEHVGLNVERVHNTTKQQSERLIWGRCNLKRSRRTVIFLPVYKISSLKITPPKTPDSFRIRYRTLLHFYLKKNRLEFRFRSRDFSFNLFPVWQPYCWRFWSAIVPIHTSTINAPKKGAYNPSGHT